MVLINRHALNVAQVAELAQVRAATERRWRTNPASENYRAMTEGEFARFEKEFEPLAGRGRAVRPADAPPGTA